MTRISCACLLSLSVETCPLSLTTSVSIRSDCVCNIYKLKLEEEGSGDMLPLGLSFHSEGFSEQCRHTSMVREKYDL